MLQKFLPEMNLDIIKDSVVCNSCSDSFTAYTAFFKSCFNVQERMKHSENGGHQKVTSLDLIKTEEVYIKVEDKFTVDFDDKLENIKFETMKIEPFSMKTEGIEQ